MEIMTAIAWLGVMVLVGMVLRAKVPFFRKNLIPASVIAGLLGFVLMNLNVIPVAYDSYNVIVGQLFTFVFISMAMTNHDKSGEKVDKKSGSGKWTLRGILGMGSWWAVLYGTTPILAYFLLKVVGKPFGMDPVYGLQIPFAFCQGPGQSVAYGAQMEADGVVNAVTVGMTFASIGFLFAFGIGIPMAKYGIKKGLCYATGGKISDSVAAGVFPREEQKPYGKVTTYSGNVDTLTFHVALIGLGWIVGIYAGKLWLLIPGYVGNLMSGMLYFNGMCVSYGIKALLKKYTHVMEYVDSGTQNRISGMATDLMVVGAFMGIEFAVIKDWIIPILIVCIVVAVFTWFASQWYCQRIGGPCDFERTLGMWGANTGTVPSGLALIRIVDPDLKASASMEMGPMNPVNSLGSNIILPAILTFAAGACSFDYVLIACLGVSAAYMVFIIAVGAFGKKTYDLRKAELYPVRGNLLRPDLQKAADTQAAAKE